MKRLLRFLVLLLLLIVAVGAALVAGDVLAGAQPADFTNIVYLADDVTSIDAYLAVPDEGEAPFPAVLMVHEWWGINGEITEMANRLAEQGYVVLAMDTYRGKTASTVPGALFLRITADEARVDRDVQAAFEYLTMLDEVDAERIGIIGFCYGGGVALRYAVANSEIRATVNLYGDTISDSTQFGALLTNERPLLGIFGAEDAQIPVAEVQAFEAALSATDIPHTVTIYPGVGHAFVNPAGIDAGGAAQEAWTQILDFFEANLKNAEV